MSDSSSLDSSEQLRSAATYGSARPARVLGKTDISWTLAGAGTAGAVPRDTAAPPEPQTIDARDGEVVDAAERGHLAAAEREERARLAELAEREERDRLAAIAHREERDRLAQLALEEQRKCWSATDEQEELERRLLIEKQEERARAASLAWQEQNDWNSALADEAQRVDLTPEEIEERARTAVRKIAEAQTAPEPEPEPDVEPHKRKSSLFQDVLRSIGFRS